MNVNKVLFKDEDFQITADEQALLKEMTPVRDNLIVRLIESEPVSAGGIVLAAKDVEKTTIGVVLKSNTVSYHRDGTPTTPTIRMGDLVRLQRGNVGTSMPEATEGQKWVCVPEDCIYYSRTLKVNTDGQK